MTGVSGSGKSTLVIDTLLALLQAHFSDRKRPSAIVKDVHGLQYLDKVIHVDQSPIGRTPRSNPATYTGVFTDIRALFAELPEAKVRGYTASRFFIQCQRAVAVKLARSGDGNDQDQHAFFARRLRAVRSLQRQNATTAKH